MKGLTVLVTGAAGSIGARLCERISAREPGRLVKLDRVGVEGGVVVDVRDEAALRDVFRSVVPDVVIHAAANKYLPFLEAEPWEAVDHNVLGTRNVVRLCRAFGTKTMVLVSTDKAVEPVSILGYSKRAAELYTLASGYSCVRFVNVFGSSGSVVETFRRQIALGGPVTITNPEMTRFFMQPDDACQLILGAVDWAEGADLFILDGGLPVKIVDVAKQLMREAGREVDIQFIGARPGDRVHEVPMLPNPEAAKVADRLWRIRARSSESADGVIAPLLGLTSETPPGVIRDALRRVALPV